MVIKPQHYYLDSVTVETRCIIIFMSVATETCCIIVWTGHLLTRCSLITHTAWMLKPTASLFGEHGFSYQDLLHYYVDGVAVDLLSYYLDSMAVEPLHSYLDS